MKTKTVTVAVQIQLDIEDNGNDVQNVINIFDTLNNALYRNYPEYSPQIFTSDIDDSSILRNEVEGWTEIN